VQAGQVNNKGNSAGALDSYRVVLTFIPPLCLIQLNGLRTNCLRASARLCSHEDLSSVDTSAWVQLSARLCSHEDLPSVDTSTSVQPIPQAALALKTAITCDSSLYEAQTESKGERRRNSRGVAGSEILVTIEGHFICVREGYQFVRTCAEFGR
jgi:hypothetical protein